MEAVNKYKLIGLGAAAVAVAACFYAYFSGSGVAYSIAFPVVAASFYVMATAELLYAKNRGARGALGYIQPAFYFIAAALTTAATVWYFIGG